MDWRVFFIGPMSPPFDQNLGRLRQLMLNYLVRKRGYKAERRGSPNVVVKGDDRIQAIIPQDDRLPSGSIPQSVFHQIDNADLVVADLTGGRAAVAYELAMAHALGVQTALVGKAPAEDLMFYLTQYKLLEIDLAAPDYRLKSSLPPEPIGRAIDHWLAERGNLSGAENPLSSFYGAPLYDISAASGLAAGFYQNFVRPILARGRLPGDGSRSPDSPEELVTANQAIRGLIVLRPDRLTDVIPDVEAELEARLRGAFPGRRIRSGRGQPLTVTVEQGTRTALFAVDDYLIDIPRTMFSLAQCYRLQRLEKSSATDARHRDHLSGHMQEILINRFFDDLRRRVRSDSEVSNGRFHFGTLDEIPLIIRTGKSRTFEPGIPPEWKRGRPRKS